MVATGVTARVCWGGSVRSVWRLDWRRVSMTRQPVGPKRYKTTKQNRFGAYNLAAVVKRTRHERRWTIAAAAVARGKEPKGGSEPSIVVVVRTAGRPLNKEGRAPH
jgi:hypothetical protein